MLLDELQSRLPPECIQLDVDVIESYSKDRAVFESAGTASILVMPGSTAEVVAAVEAANAADVPIVPRGAGTGLTGAANAVDGCMVLSLHRMNEILEIDTTNRSCRVQPGVINSDLKAEVAKHGLFYPPDPASFVCCVKYGVTRDYVMGLEVVMASGEVMNTGRKTIKSTTGLDLTGLFVGSEGVLGIITEITLKLVPAPAPPATAVAYFDRLEPAGEAIVDIFKQGYEPSLMEIVDQTSLRQVEAVFPMDLDVDAACLLLMQTAGDDSAKHIIEISDLCTKHGATFVYHVEDPHEGDMLIEVRRKVWPAFEHLGKALLPEDVAVPRGRLPELLAGITEIAERNQVLLPTIGHAGDGNMHPLLVFDGNDAEEVARVKVAFAEIVDLSLSLDGTIAGEHGVGTLKRQFIEQELDETQLKFQRGMRTLLDPDQRLNPGKAL